jgi:hypothetical protein
MSRSSVVTKFKKSLHLLTDAVENKLDLDRQHPKIYKKLYKFYSENGVEFTYDPYDDYEILLDALYTDLYSEGIIFEENAEA